MRHIILQRGGRCVNEFLQSLSNYNISLYPYVDKKSFKNGLIMQIIVLDLQLINSIQITSVDIAHVQYFLTIFS